MKPPQSVRLFELLLIGGAILSVGNVLFHYEKVRIWASALDGPTPTVTIFTRLFVAAIFWFFIARRASNVARWLCAAFFALAAVTMPWDYTSDRLVGPGYAWTFIAAAMVQAIGAAVLFRKDARDWFKTRGRGPDLEDVFS